MLWWPGDQFQPVFSGLNKQVFLYHPNQMLVYEDMVQCPGTGVVHLLLETAEQHWHPMFRKQNIENDIPT